MMRDGADPPDGLLDHAAFGFLDVAALLVLPDGRYQMQLRDDFPHINVPDHWGCFGGRVEAGETPRQALLRELWEELEFTPRTADWFTESGLVIPQMHVGPTHKTFFHVPVTEAEVAGMVQHEGAAMRTFTIESLMAEPRVVPWDLYGVLLHARQHVVFNSPSSIPNEAANLGR